jgi:hypothetical protein
MLPRMPGCSSSSRYAPHAYCTPRSEWCTSPGQGRRPPRATRNAVKVSSASRVSPQRTAASLAHPLHPLAGSVGTDSSATDHGGRVMRIEMLQGFFKKSFSNVSWPILRSRFATVRSSGGSLGPALRPVPGNDASLRARHSPATARSAWGRSATAYSAPTLAGIHRPHHRYFEITTVYASGQVH